MIIGISGLAGSGKDTIADYITKRYEFEKIALADPLKRFVMNMFDFSEDQLWGSSEKRSRPDYRYPREHGPWVDNKCMCCGVDKTSTFKHKCYLTPRLCLQIIGTQGFRACYEDIWLKICLRDAKKLDADRGYSLSYSRTTGIFYPQNKCCISGIVISDLRFLNEIKKVKDEGIIIKAKRPQAGLKGALGCHSSEMEQSKAQDDMFDFIINNTGNFEYLYSNIDHIFRKLGF